MAQDADRRGRLAAARASAEALRGRALRAYEALEASRSRRPLVDVGFEFAERDRESGAGLIAGALAYRLFLWLLPLALILVGGLGFLHASDEEDPSEVADELGAGELAAETVADAAAQAESGRWVLVVFGLWLFLYASRSLAKALRVSHALAWGQPVRESGAKLSNDLLVGVLPIGFLILSGLGGWTDRRFGLWAGLVASVVLLGGEFGLWLLMSARLPHRGAPLVALLPGVALFVAGLGGLRLFTTYLIVGRLERASSLYGALGTAVVLLFWLFLIGRVATASATLNAVLWDRRLARARAAP